MATSQPAPSKPARHAQSDEGRQTPCDEQLRWQRAGSAHASPLQPGLQPQRPVWRSHAPWPEHGWPRTPIAQSSNGSLHASPVPARAAVRVWPVGPMRAWAGRVCGRVSFMGGAWSEARAWMCVVG
eukprot:2844589-Prymnesium_polylepis.1